jgi:poly-gamma-glutamate synthesis protein (capsule biosynthesis protein)
MWVIAGCVGIFTPAAFTQPEYEDFSGYPWYFLRDGLELSDREDVVSILAVGDLMLGRQVFSDPALFQKAPWIAQADLVLGNFEASLAKNEQDWKQGNFEDSQLVLKHCLGNGPKIDYERSNPPEKPIPLIAPPWAPIILRKAGFDVLNLANNHTLDSGYYSLEEQARSFSQSGMDVVGAGATYRDAIKPVVREIRGITIAIIGFTMVAPGIESESGVGDWVFASWQRDEIIQAIRDAHSQYDMVIVFPHWGDEYSPLANTWQKSIARELTSAGADLVIGHHPHVVQSTHIWNDPDRARMVAFSLGNFVSDQCAPDFRKGLALQVFVGRSGLRAVRALPVNTTPHPDLLSSEEAIGWLEKFRPIDKQIFFRCGLNNCQEIDLEQNNSELMMNHSAKIWAGQIDLTGNGQLETIRKIDGRIIVYENGIEIWKSPPEWQVVDFALGDPNHDGRGEILIALNKLDPAGALQSHPFIVGHRGGVYRLLWGGSAVAEKILEVEIGDLDGDMDDELLVIESHSDGKRSISLWRWHGWGFSLEWRSSSSYYRSLRLFERDGQPYFSVDIPYGSIMDP